MDILCLGQQNWDHAWTGKQQLTTRLAERGHRVLYIDPDLPDPDTAGTIRSASVKGVPGLRPIGPGDLWVWTYLPLPALGWNINQRRRIRLAPRILSATGFHAPAALCLHPRQLPWLKGVRAQAWIYYAVDEYTAYAAMDPSERQRIRDLEEQILASADVALAVSPTLRDRFASINPASFILENGSDVEHYHPEKLARIATHSALTNLRGPVIGFIGQVDQRLDQALIAGLARSHPDWNIVLAGRVESTDISQLERFPNVHVLGYQPYAALPSLARRVDVWTVPYIENELTHSCNPLKVYEYLASGKPVVSRPLAGLIVCRDVVSLASTEADFRAAIEAALASPRIGRDERLRRAEENDWNVRVNALENHLVQAVERARHSGRWMSAITPLPKARTVAGRLESLPTVSEYGNLRRRSWLPLRWRIAVGAARAAGLGIHAAGRVREAAQPDATVRRILVARLGHLGDFIVLAPTLSFLRKRFPDAKIVLGIQEGSIATQVYAHSPDVDRIEPIDFVPWRSAIPRSERIRRLRRLFSARYDLVITGAYWFMLEEAHLTGAPRLVGTYDGHPIQEVQGRVLRRDRSFHEADNALAVVEAATGVVADDATRQPRLIIPEQEAEERSAAVLRDLSVTDRSPVLLVHPGSKLPTRRWPPKKFAAAIARILDNSPGLTVVFTGTEGEQRQVEEIVSHLPERIAGRVRNSVGRTDFVGLAGLVQRSSAVLSNDTGMLHLARTLGAPLVAVLGPENHRLWGPHPLGDARAIGLRREVPCAPCFLKTCKDHYCMESLPVDDVVEAAMSVLADGHTKPGGRSLELRLMHHNWGSLARLGFNLPRVTVVVLEETESSLYDALTMAEGQTYPSIEIVLLRTAGSVPWSDERDPERRRTLPILALDAPPGNMTERLRFAAERSSGDLVILAKEGAVWRPKRLSLDVAAFVRTESADYFLDGRPVLDLADGHATARRTALLQ